MLGRSVQFVQVGGLDGESSKPLRCQAHLHQLFKTSLLRLLSDQPVLVGGHPLMNPGPLNYTQGIPLKNCHASE